jgi:diguanylate cyclase (GGDEF)-like protein/PAS domain S-box-containing protein
MRQPDFDELKNLFALSVDMMCILDGSKLLVVNPALIAGLGYTEEELLGRLFMDMAHPDDLERVSEEVASLFQGKATVAFQSRIRTGSGEMRWFQWSSRADIDTGFIYSVGRDITNQRATEEKLQQYTEMLERSQRELKEAIDDLSRLASTDQLTGLLNRRAFESRVEDEISRSERSGTPLGLAILDIDHFKRVNDEYGHPMGDVVLREVARRMEAGSRREDVVARWGGEEFAILFPESSLPDARLAAERIVLSVSARPVVLGPVTLTIRVSGGVTTRQGFDRGSTLELISAADALLLLAKRNGRDRIESGEMKTLGLAS